MFLTWCNLVPCHDQPNKQYYVQFKTFSQIAKYAHYLQIYNKVFFHVPCIVESQSLDLYFSYEILLYLKIDKTKNKVLLIAKSFLFLCAGLNAFEMINSKGHFHIWNLKDLDMLNVPI